MNPLRNNNQRNMLQQFMNSGKYTQQDLERAKAMAEQFKNLLK